MYNTDMPTRAELPSSARLLRSTLIAFVTAAVLLVTVVMPADYGIDPTGIGRALNLTEMGEIKKELAAEAAADAAAQPAGVEAAAAVQAIPAVPVASPSAAPETPKPVWRDETRFTLQPGEGIEIKLSMNKDARALYAWAVEGGVVNFDTHGDALGRSISYEKGRGVASDDGELVAAFDGKHGWFWRNRGNSAVTMLLQTGGDYSGIDR